MRKSLAIVAIIVFLTSLGLAGAFLPGFLKTIADSNNTTFMWQFAGSVVSGAIGVLVLIFYLKRR